MTSQPRIYADHAASSPLRPEAAEAMREAESALNPAGQYRTGRDARRLLEDAREQIAELLGADPVEVIFTASGTEADNIAVQGLAFGSRKLHPTAGDIIAPASSTRRWGYPSTGCAPARLTWDTAGSSCPWTLAGSSILKRLRRSAS